MKKSSIWSGTVRHQGIVNGRYALEADADNERPAGTLVCEPASPDDGQDVTFTYRGARFLDEGVWTPRS